MENLKTTEKKKWELIVADNLDYKTALSIGNFISSFANSEENRYLSNYQAQYYLWKIVENPHGCGFVSLAVDKGKIVGTTTITRKKIWFRGQWVNGAEIGDTFTDPDYQRMGIFTKLVKSTRDRALKSGVQLIYGTPNSQSLPGYEKNCSFHRKRGLNTFLWALPLKPGAIISRMTTRYIPSLAGSIADWTTDKLIGTIGNIISDDCKVERPDFNTDFDELDEILRQKYSFMLSRKANDLKFRIADNPDVNHYGVITRRADEKLKGVLIFKHTFKKGFKTLHVADLYGCDLWSLTKLWHAAILSGLKEGYEMIVTGMPLNINSVLSTLPIVPSPVSRKDVIFYDENIMGSEALSDTGRWHFSLIDTDNI